MNRTYTSWSLKLEIEKNGSICIVEKLIVAQSSFSETTESVALYVPNVVTAFGQLFLTHGNYAKLEAVFHKLSGWGMIE